MAQRQQEIRIGAFPVEETGQHQRAARDQRPDRENLRIADIDPQRALAQRNEVGAEVEHRDHHEDHQHRFDRRRIEAGDARVTGREPAQGHRRKRVTDRLVPGHPQGLERQDAQDGQSGIQQPEVLGRLGDARRELRFLDRPGRLGLVELHAAHAQDREDGDRQHDDAHAAVPVQGVAPQVDRLRQMVEPGQHGGPGGGEARHRLEESVGEAQALDLEHQRHGGHCGHQAPAQHHQQRSVARMQLAPVPPGRAEQQRADHERGSARQDEAAMSAVGHGQRPRHRHQVGDREDHQEAAQYMGDRQQLLHG